MTQTKTPHYHPSVEQEMLPRRTRASFIFPLVMLLLIEGTIVLVNAILPLRGLWFYDSLVPQSGSWSLIPTRLLFPHLQLIFGQSRLRMSISLGATWKEAFLLFGALTLLFVLYFVALYYLPKRISQRFILLSTFLFGLTFALSSVVTSQDLFSYIGYARMGVIYHLNPLTTFPTAIRHDPIYSDMFWVNQPSLYGPVWTMITSTLQWLLLALGIKQILPMVVALRLFSLAIHLGSTQLIWLIIGRLQQLHVFPLLHTQNRRIFATLAFAWNPFVLFDTCINAHSDSTVIFLILLVIWTLLPQNQSIRFSRYSNILTAILFAVVICLKVNFVLLLPGFFLFLWTRQAQIPWRRRMSNSVLVACVCLGTTVLIYAPFWSNGAIVHSVQVNPNTAHEANSLYEFFMRLYASRTHTYIPSATVPTGTKLEAITHTISTLLFAVAYLILCVRALFMPRTINTLPALIRWMTLAWLSYCLLGTPWFWPWYLVTFFGLFALAEAVPEENAQPSARFDLFRMPLVARALAFTALTVHCFYTWAPHIVLVPYIFHSQWLYLRGLWIWLLPLLVLGSYLFVTQPSNFGFKWKVRFNYLHVSDTIQKQQ